MRVPKYCKEYIMYVYVQVYVLTCIYTHGGVERVAPSTLAPFCAVFLCSGRFKRLVMYSRVRKVLAP
ncbi:hypothetical protein DFP73DRAFT_553346 [Morchella snyderi]|nr:hypothetical protein DFP73DRAFT_553346 [Morchella snyderi]